MLVSDIFEVIVSGKFFFVLTHPRSVQTNFFDIFRNSKALNTGLT